MPKKFVKDDNVPFPVYIDKWNNEFAETYHAWPDQYYCIDFDYNVICKSDYNNAIINVDCLELINKMIK